MVGYALHTIAVKFHAKHVKRIDISRKRVLASKQSHSNCRVLLRIFVACGTSALIHFLQQQLFSPTFRQETWFCVIHTISRGPLTMATEIGPQNAAGGRYIISKHSMHWLLIKHGFTEIHFGQTNCPEPAATLMQV